MKSKRAQLLEWAEQGSLPAGNVRDALALAGVTPDGARWQRFIAALFLWLGALLFAAGVIFFFAYNWDAMSRFAKFGLLEGLLVASIAAAFVAGLDHAAGKAAVLLASLLTGALLALIGQTYQTGADPYELFVWWAILILPWTFAARLPALWLLLLLLLNLTTGLYYAAFGNVFGLLNSAGSLAWAFLILNTAALAAWEFVAQSGIAWLRDRWPVRIVAVASGGAASMLAVWGILEHESVGPFAVPAYLAWLVAAYLYYRHQVKDLFVLAGGVLSAIIVVTTFLGDSILRHSDAGGFLLIGIIVIAMSAGGAWWLKNVAAEVEE